MWGCVAHQAALAVMDGRNIAVAEIGTGKLLALDASRPDAREVLAEGLEQPMGLVRRGSEWFVTDSAAGRASAPAAPRASRVAVEGPPQPRGPALPPDGAIAAAANGTGRGLRPAAGNGVHENKTRRHRLAPLPSPSRRRRR